MTRKRLEEVKAEALAEVNQIRVALGHKPRKTMPKGTPTEPGTCPIANLLSIALPGVSVGGKTFTVERRRRADAERLAERIGGGTVEESWNGYMVVGNLPRVVHTFIMQFDKYAYPELEV